MKKIFLTALPALAVSWSATAGLITAVPGADDQGGMIMPMVTITATAGTGANPTAGTINVNWSPTTPDLKPLTQWSSGDWFADTAAWRADLSPVDGTVAGMPSANAGAGDLFSSRYGFMFMTMSSMMKANVPAGKSLAIKMTSISTLDLTSFNYGNADNRWDEVWSAGVNSQVLWNGSMWHNYYVMPAGSAAGTYSASYEVFIANTPFTGTTGFAQYDAAADAAVKDTNFTSANVTYTWTVIPEPTSAGLLALAGAAFFLRWTRRRVNQN